MMMNNSRQYAPATLRNRDFILGILRDVLPTKGVILEIASGSRRRQQGRRPRGHTTRLLDSGTKSQGGILVAVGNP